MMRRIVTELSPYMSWYKRAVTYFTRYYSVRCTILSLAGCYYFPFSAYSVLLWDTFELGYCVVVTVTMGTFC